jgi:hypothetical protein
MQRGCILLHGVFPLPTDAEVIAARILEVAGKARRVSSGAESIEQHDLSSLVKALEAVEGNVDPDAIPAGFGLRFCGTIPPGPA